MRQNGGDIIKTIEGTVTSAIVYTDLIEQSAVEQVRELCSQPFAGGSKIRIMPDVHTGVGCTIGTTMTIADKVVPNLVGVDIGCGMEVAILGEKRVELSRLDKVIHENVPAGFRVREKPHALAADIDMGELRCAKSANLERAERSIGTLGGGNHFIELDADDEGTLYLVVHSGSRHIGNEVAKHYQTLAVEQRKKDGQGGQKGQKEFNKQLAYLDGALFDDYIHDMSLTQRFAMLNRQAIISSIMRAMKFDVVDSFTTIHNYIDLQHHVLRKGAVSAQKGERLLIPINMRDGSLICTGLGNPDWNCSAPHGAGRIMSRTEAKNSITLTEFAKSMDGIYTSTVNKGTLDEAPMAYKPMESLLANIGDTVVVEKRIRPLYNFKAAE